MGRPRKYTTEEERREANSASKRDYYYKNRRQIQKRRKIHRLSHAGPNYKTRSLPDAEHIIEEPTLEERHWHLESPVALIDVVLSDVQELRQQVGDLERQMDKAFAGGPDAQACSKLFDRLSGLAEDLENAKNYCSQGLEKLHTGGFQRIIEWRDYQGVKVYFALWIISDYLLIIFGFPVFQFSLRLTGSETTILYGLISTLRSWLRLCLDSVTMLFFALRMELRQEYMTLRIRINKLITFRNGAQMRKVKNKPGPSSCSHNEAFSNFKAWGGENFLMPDLSIIREIKEAMGGDELLAFKSAEFSGQAQAAYDTLTKYHPVDDGECLGCVYGYACY
ncbi:hypothetical protein C8J56DRAFT_1032388 [Mycena floridula]|nr:hypothetical protein C8J56DRAFT_1032388 [Mycena floridula]